MEVIATQKFVRMSPRKLRLLIPDVKQLTPANAVKVLPLSGKRAAIPLLKAINTAIANAKNRRLSEADLIFKEIQVNDGPRLKRGRPVARGRWHPYQKKMSHIRIVLMTKEPEAIKKARKKIEDESVKEKKGKKVAKVDKQKLEKKSTDKVDTKKGGKLRGTKN